MKKEQTAPLKITAIYMLTGCAWILFSDHLAAMMTRDAETLTHISTMKGWFFVVVTAGLLYTLVRRQMSALLERNEELAVVEEDLRNQVDQYHQAQTRLLEVNQTLQALFQASPLAIVAIDPQGRVTQWNRTAEWLFGWRADEVIGKPYPLISADNHEEYRRFFQNTLQGEVLNDIEARRLRKNGEFLDVSVSTAPLRDFDGEISGIVVVLADITLRKEAMDALKHSHRQYASLVDSIDGIVWELELATFRFTFISRRAESILGYTPALWLSEANFWQDHIHPDDRKWTLEFCATATAEKRDHEFEYRFLAANGRTVWLRDIVTVIVEDDRPVALRGVMFDVTERIKAEEEIRRLNAELEQRVVERTAELEGANRELESFSYSVSHDLRAPLRHIEGFSKALVEDYSDKLDTQGKMYLQRLRGATQRMGQLIDDLLKLSSVTNCELDLKPINLSRMAQIIALELKQTQPERRVRYCIAEEVMAKGDARLLRVVLANLLGNAWKYTGKREEAIIEFGVTDAGGGPAYYVRDNGAGFDMAYAGKLFGAFQRLHSMEEFEGTGIGLATVQRVIRRHGGDVWAEGEVDRGATFYFTLGERSTRGGEIKAHQR